MMRFTWKGFFAVVFAGSIALAIGLGRIARAAPPSVPVQIVGTTPSTTDDVNSVVSCSATPPGTTLVAASAGRQAIIIQNQSNVAVCISKSTTLMAACPGAASATTGSFVLKAGTAIGDGSGGTITFSQYSGSIACLSNSGAALVGVQSFAR